MKKSFSILLSLLFMVVVLVSCSPSVPVSFSELDKDEQESYAELFAEKIVKSNLKAPSTAKVEVLSIDSLGDNTYEVSGYVDAENGFGAMLRNDFTVKLQVKNEYEKDHDGYSCRTIDVRIQ